MRSNIVILLRSGTSFANFFLWSAFLTSKTVGPRCGNVVSLVSVNFLCLRIAGVGSDNGALLVDREVRIDVAGGSKLALRSSTIWFGRLSDAVFLASAELVDGVLKQILIPYF